MPRKGRPQDPLTDEQLLDLVAERARDKEFFFKLWCRFRAEITQAKLRDVRTQRAVPIEPVEPREFTLENILEGLRPSVKAKFKAERDRGFDNPELIKEIIALKAKYSWPRVADEIHREHNDWCGEFKGESLTPKSRRKLADRFRSMYRRYKRK
jgi:hypothetical protein